jgi:proton glutamate symport protein
MTDKKKKFPLHLRIIVFMILGIVWGIFAAEKSWGKEITIGYIKPFGTIFIKLLQVVAIPLVLSSLISGIAKLKDMTKLARIGGKTILLFLCTAFIATSLGIAVVSITQPGKSLPSETREKLMAAYSSNTEKTIHKAETLQESPLSTLVDMVPDNIFSAASENTRMIQVVFFAILFGVALVKIDSSKSEIVVQFFDSDNEVLIKMVGMIMQVAPIGVFALMAAMIVEVSGKDAVQLLLSLLSYGLTIIAGLLIMLFIVYPLIFTNLSKIKYLKFFKEMRPAFLLAFTTSSSNATLPVTMQRVEKHLGIPEEITGFVLPFGTTINMDGTALYQSVAAVFIAQALGLELSFLQMAVIVLTATIAAAGAAGVPGAGMITLVIVLESIGVPAAGIALIMAPDRILDMCRTVVNVAGDAVAAVVIANSESPISTGKDKKQG